MRRQTHDFVRRAPFDSVRAHCVLKFTIWRARLAAASIRARRRERKRLNDRTTDQATVLRFLADGLKLRVRTGVWRLKQPGYVDRFEDCPGGKITIDELAALGYIDARNNLTEAGRLALASAQS